MKVEKRREAMLKAVLSGMNDVAALCEHFGMSEATVRRDLRALAEERRIVRTYGGAASVGVHEPEESLDTRRGVFGNRRKPSRGRRRGMCRTATRFFSTAARRPPRSRAASRGARTFRS